MFKDEPDVVAEYRELKLDFWDKSIDIEDDAVREKALTKQFYEAVNEFVDDYGEIYGEQCFIPTEEDRRTS